MRGPVPKQFLVVRNKPVLVYILEAFQRAVAVEDIIVVSLPEWTGIVEQYVKDCGLTRSDLSYLEVPAVSTPFLAVCITWRNSIRLRTSF